MNENQDQEKHNANPDKGREKDREASREEGREEGREAGREAGREEGKEKGEKAADDKATAEERRAKRDKDESRGGKDDTVLGEINDDE